jgi:hypothetical protein
MEMSIPPDLVAGMSNALRELFSSVDIVSSIAEKYPRHDFSSLEDSALL